MTAGFAGQVTRFPKLPASLNKNLLENKNNVPALTFEVTQEYTDIKTWTPPLLPSLEDTPNAYQSQCVPFFKDTPFCYNAKKRQTNPGMANAACNGAKPVAWFKKYLLFPKTSKIAAAQVKEIETFFCFFVFLFCFSTINLLLKCRAKLTLLV